ncbi:MAG: hypothetical protein JNN10_04580 [Sphingopyxis sp.]|uniref:hypothetical protein n=1 Tax=Sphingopyxis sp. TaxID=1908224 RepID=UPI001A5DA2C0|nr:hypothetical protein [Sphingopyxis sp.]MBL9065551.1 hypothetical protein [Sphingopyxis sp.]
MRRLARVVGMIWMVACAALWLWVGFGWDWNPVASLPFLSNWTVLALLHDNKLGMTMVPIFLGGLGYVAYRWGRGEPLAD